MRFLFTVIALGSVFGCGDDSAPAEDAGFDASTDAIPECEVNEDCDDGLFCTGVEVCDEGSCTVVDVPACDDAIACTIDRCSEDRRECVSSAADEDGDGHPSAACLDATGEPLGDDCDDADGDRYPGNREVCDAENHDEDCDDSTYGVVDVDRDGFDDLLCCNIAAAGGMNCGNDCDDSRANVNARATEACDRFDNDCDGRVDEGVASVGFADADRDGFGDDAVAMTACPGAVGFSVSGGDCNDEDIAVRPGQLELCDEVDNDCDLTVDEDTGNAEWFVDGDADGYGAVGSTAVLSCERLAGYSLLATDCNDTEPAVSPRAAEMCDGIDNDCNGSADFEIGPGDLEDDDGDGLVDIACVPLGTDCNDRDPAVGLGAVEICDGRDNDCDGEVDEGAEGSLWFRDMDGDGYGSSASGTTVSCLSVDGYRRTGGDCDDDNADRNPGAAEACNGADDNCNVTVDEGATPPMGCAPPNASAVCAAGACGAGACNPGFADCDRNAANGCESDLSAADNCGSCFNRCLFANGTGACGVGGVCELAACLPLWGDCDLAPANGCEQWLSSEDHCGGCGEACLASTGGVCTSGTCIQTECPDGFRDCNGLASDGCETDVETLTDCGDCGSACSPANSVGATCGSGRCEFTCDPGFADCNGDPSDGCETNVSSDLLNCGGCGRGCFVPDGVGACVAGMCEVDSCAVNRGDCNGSPEDGCEADFLADPRFCGDCDTECDYPNAVGNCTGGTCAIGGCNPGFTDCTGGIADGCETNTWFDEANCNGCGLACAPTGAVGRCDIGSCLLDRCLPGRQSCDFSDTTGCETDILADSDNCGGCGNQCSFNRGCAATPTSGPRCEAFLALAAGHDFSCSLSLDSRVSCWGNNIDGVFGDGTTMSSVSPVFVEMGGIPMTGFTDISGGDSHTCGVVAGNVYCWGLNGAKQLGDGSVTDRTSPTQVSGLPAGDPMVEVEAGFAHTCALTASGRVWCWGANGDGQLGRGTFSTSEDPAEVSSLRAVDLALGGFFTCAIDDMGGPQCWGNNMDGQLGIGSVGGPMATPQPIPMIANAVQVSLGLDHACIVRRAAGDYVQCWGRNNRGQLGIGTFAQQSTPTSLASAIFSPVEALSLGAEHSCVLDGRNEPQCWGSNQYSQVGNGSTLDEPYPVVIPAVQALLMSAGGPNAQHTFIWDGPADQVFGWGRNQDAQLNMSAPSTISMATPMSGL